MTHVEKAKQLSRKRDKATDQEKIQIEDTLRQMKTTEAQLRKTYDAIHLKFRTWKEQHADEIPSRRTTRRFSNGPNSGSP